MKSIIIVAIVAVLSFFTQGCASDRVNRASDQYGQEKGLNAEAEMRLSLIQEDLSRLASRRSHANARCEARRIELLNSGISSVESDPYYSTWLQERSDSEAQAIGRAQELKTYVAQMNTSELRAMHRWRDSWEARDGWFTQILRTVI